MDGSFYTATFAKNYIMAGGGMAQLQAILGHSTLDMTRKYVNLYENMTKEELIRELVLAKINEARAKKGYEVKGVGAEKKYIKYVNKNIK